VTTRLYYTEPYRTTFDATVTSCESRQDLFALRLDQTAFYPSSGGQPFDTGTLGDARVVDVVDEEEEVVHLADRAIDTGTRVSGAIDWARRFDHMQQHTGQHVLSAAYDRLFGVRTESFHLGVAAATIDLHREVTPAEIRDAENEANRIVWEDRPVSIRFVTVEEAAALPLRKEPARAGSLRLIDVQDFDLSACGGTHVARTGAIGTIATASWEKLRGGTRIEFLCGGRALARFREWRDALSAATRHLSVTPPDLAAAIERLQGDAKSQQRAMRTLQEQLAAHEGRALAGRAEPVPQGLAIADALDGWDAASLKTLAVAATVEAPSAAVVLFSRTMPAVVVVARGAESQVNAAAVLKALITRFGGKGGGKAEIAQGGGLVAPEVGELVAEARRLLAG
jgi:alanyl-tRNA synthetase